MDYYKKYIKYKTKYLELKRQIKGGTVGHECKNDDQCNTKKEYCGRNLFGLMGNTCKEKKGKGSNCDRNEQCNGSCKVKSGSNLDGTKKCS